MSDDEFEVDNDNEWISKMKNNDNLYNDFYQVETKWIKIYSLYVNNKKELDQNPEHHPPHQDLTRIVMVDTKATGSVSTHLYQI